MTNTNDMDRFRNEADVKRAIGKMLTKYEWGWWMPPANMYGRGGQSDFLAAYGGMFMAVEAKWDLAKGTHPVTQQQKKFLTMVQENRCYGFVVDRHRLGDLEIILETHRLPLAEEVLDYAKIAEESIAAVDRLMKFE